MLMTHSKMEKFRLHCTPYVLPACLIYNQYRITNIQKKYFKIVYDSLVSDFYTQINTKFFILMSH